MLISAILLAAGSSSRMKEHNKLLLPLQDKTILEHTLESVLKSQAREVIVVTGYQSKAIERVIRKKRYGIAMVHNRDFQSGMTSSIQTGIKAADPKSEGFMLCLADMPFLLSSHYNQIIEAFEEAHLKDPWTIVVPFFDNRRGNPVIFSRAYRQDILHHTNMEGCKSLIDQNTAHIHKIEMKTGIEKLDIDVKEDYESAIGKPHP